MRCESLSSCARGLDLSELETVRSPEYNAAVGGAPNSQHIYFRALDLDLLDKSAANKKRLARAVLELWNSPLSTEQKIGIGAYPSDLKYGAKRIHIDTGWRRRTWSDLGKLEEYADG